MSPHHICANNLNELIDCSFYQTAASCHKVYSPYQSILSSEGRFQPMRHYFNDIRCRMLTKLVQRDITGREFIRAFEQASNMIENLYMTNSNIHNDTFIDQLVDITHDFILESPYKCLSTSHVSDPIKHDEFPLLPISSPTPQLASSLSKTKASSSSQQALSAKTNSDSTPLPSTRQTISSSPFSITKSLPSRPETPPFPILSRHSSEDQSFSMGYQWKGEDN